MTAFFTTTTAAAELGVSAGRVRALIAAGRLQATLAGRDWLILPKALDLGRVLPNDEGRQFFQRAAVGLIAGVGFAEAGDAFVGVQANPHPVGLDSLDQAQVVAETYRLDFGDLHRAHAFGGGLRLRRPGSHSGRGGRREQFSPAYRFALSMPSAQGCTISRAFQSPFSRSVLSWLVALSFLAHNFSYRWNRF